MRSLPDTPDKMRSRQHDALLILDELLDEELPPCTWMIFPARPLHLMGQLEGPNDKLLELLDEWASFLHLPVQRRRRPPWTWLLCQGKHRGIFLEITAGFPDPVEEDEDRTPLEDLVGNWARRRPRLSPDPDPDEIDRTGEFEAAYLARDL